MNVSRNTLVSHRTALENEIAQLLERKTQAQTAIDSINRQLYARDQHDHQQMVKMEGNKKFEQLIAGREVDRLYIGKDHVCRCGCAGNYHKAGTRAFKSAVTKMKVQLAHGTGTADDVQKEYLNFSMENDRAITLYFKEQTIQ